VPMITVELLTDAAEFAALEREWQALWQQAGGSVFQSHPWVCTWLHHDSDAKRYRLHIAVARIDGRIAAILPLAIRRQYGIGVLEWAAQRFSDYCDGLGPPELLQTLWSEVRRRGGFDLARLRNVSPEAAMHPVLATEVGMSRAEGETSLRLRSVWPDGDAWLGTLNKKKRSNHARGRRILEEFGKVSIEYHDRALPTGVVAPGRAEEGIARQNRIQLGAVRPWSGIGDCLRW
jgi:CelD/BcsL family acetyltransferase involved in cellulose biosynthesis